MITALFGIGQLVALAAIIYGALLTLRNRPEFWAEMARALQRSKVFLETFDEAVRLAELARRDPYRAARVGRARLLKAPAEIGEAEPPAGARGPATARKGFVRVKEAV